MYPNEYDLHMQRRQYERDAEHHQLVKLARGADTAGSLWRRLRASLSSAQTTTQGAQRRHERKDVVALSQ